MEKKVTKKIRKKVAECMKESLDAVEIMRVSKSSGINADAVYSNGFDVNYLLKIVVLDEGEKIDDERFECIDNGLSFDIDRFDDWGISFDNALCNTIANVWLRTDGRIARVAIFAETM